jgi:Uncharacterized conserved protein related to pyruvate formate-lyase activating enzyme
MGNHDQQAVGGVSGRAASMPGVLNVVAIIVSVAVGFGAAEILHQSRGGLGPKLRRECVSLVDTVMAGDRTVSTAALKEEFAARGIVAPQHPTIWTDEAAKKAYDAKWEELRQHPAYHDAWNTVFARKREEAVKDCILNRAQREGVTVP